MSNDLFFSYASSIDGSGADRHVLVDDSPVDMLKLEKKRWKKRRREKRRGRRRRRRRKRKKRKKGAGGKGKIKII